MAQVDPISPACPICGKPPDQHYRPFCSKRCADVDLNRWLSGAYAIPASEVDDPDEEDAPGSGDAGQAKPDSL